MSLQINQFPCLSDNYGFLLHDPAENMTACVDTPDAAAINDALDAAGWSLDYILNTHHHPDHTGGNEALKERWNCTVIGPRGEAERIPAIDRPVGAGDQISIGSAVATIYDAPGHTLGHILYHFADENIAFVGDTIFALGCGRLFEGDADQMWNSLSQIAAWPRDTKLYCAHEYTQANAKFALTIEPQNTALTQRAAAIDDARAKGLATVPTTVGLELDTSPFLRANEETLQSSLGMAGESPVAVFAEVRRRKDNF